MREVMRITVETEDMNYLQRLNYEVAARYDVITTLIENHAMDGSDIVLQSPAFTTYSKQLSELKAEFELAKMKVSEKYLPDSYKENTKAVWEADFSTGEIVIKE